MSKFPLILHFEYKIKLGGSIHTEFGAIYDVYLREADKNQVLIEMWTNRVIRSNKLTNLHREPKFINSILLASVPPLKMFLLCLKTLLQSKGLKTREGYQALRIIEHRTIDEEIDEEFDNFVAKRLAGQDYL